MNSKFAILLFFSFLALNVQAQSITYEDNDNDSSYEEKLSSETSTKKTIGLNTAVTSAMMDPNQNLKKLEWMIDAKTKGMMADKSLYMGFSMTALADYQRSNRDSKFAFLMRHPTSNNQIGKTASEFVIHAAQFSIVASINDWIGAYGELLYSPEQSFGNGTITSLQRNQIDLRKGFLMFGNLNKFPLYLSIGKLDVPFGQTGSVNAWINSTTWHAFGCLGYSAVLGFKLKGLSASVSAIQGGSGFRAVNSPIDSTNVPSRVTNFAADINYTFSFGGNTTLRLGTSYLKGSSYTQGFPVVHFNPGTDDNPAYSLYGKLSAGSHLVIQGSYNKTLKEWPGTYNPNPPLNEYKASKVSAYDVGLRYTINPKSHGPVYGVSGEFSNFTAGPKGAPWERQNQYVLGINTTFEKTSRLFLEVFHTEGYAPLNFISGGNFENPGITHSDRDARSTGFVLGFLLSI